MRHSPSELVAGVLEGKRVFLARAITLVESRRKEDRAMADEVVDALLPHAGKALRLGVTGVPGVGKSSFIEAFGLHLLGQGHKVAVLAVDPSSVLSRGSILGDKTRMEKLSQSEAAFIRPSPSSGTLGGVASRTLEAMVLCEAAGYDVVMVETVGVGQSETAVKEMVDHFLLLMLAGAGDEIQGIKRGIMELADLVAITKSDGENRASAEKARQAYENALSLFMRSEKVDVFTTSAFSGEGLTGLGEALFSRHDRLKGSGALGELRSVQREAWFWKQVREGLLDRLLATAEGRRGVKGLLEGVKKGSLAPGRAARQLIQEGGA